MKRCICMFLVILITFGLTGCRVINIPTQENETKATKEPTHISLLNNNYDIILKDEVLKETTEIEETTENIEEPKLITTNIHSEIKENKYLSIDQQNKILQQISNIKVTDKESLNELTIIINENIASFNTREADLIIKKYILDLYSLMNDLNQVLGLIGYQLEDVVTKYEISVNDKDSILTIPDTYGVVKGFLLEVKDKGFFINSLTVNSNYYIDLDLSQILETYKDYISPSMKNYLEFNNYEMNNASNLIVNNNYNIDEIVLRINMLTKSLEEDKNYHYMMSENYASSLIYYYNLLLSLSHSQFYDSDYKFSENTVKIYNRILRGDNNEILKNILEKTILVIETNEYIYDKEIQDMISEYVNSLIYTNEIKYAINTYQNSEYVVLEKFNIK